VNREEAEEYTQGLEQNLTGSYRLYMWAQRNGIPKALGITLEEWIQRVGGHVKLSAPERRQAVTELKEEGHTNREIAKAIGVDESTVRADLSAGNPAPRKKNGSKNNHDDEDTAGNPAPDDDDDEEMTPEEVEIGQQNLRSAILMNSAATIEFTAEYYGPIDTKVIEACKRAAQAWTELATKLERRVSHG
jgi:hypothetical protein